MKPSIAELIHISGTNTERTQRPKMLVVDDEPDNLDLLYRTFRREFQVFRAESGVAALEVLTQEGEVAVIISDQRMPEMKGTEFLSRTVPKFPDTMRIILTGFTDVEDLVEAINSGQVYKYITKPWDPNELKAVVQRATETYQLLKQRTEELRRAEAQTALLSAIVQLVQQAANANEMLTPISATFGENFVADACVLEFVNGGELTGKAGKYGTTDNWLATDPLVQQAIASSKVQGCADISSDPALATVEHYQASSIQAHLAVPIIYRGQVLAIMSLQWKQRHTLREDEVVLIHLAAQQVGLALVCLSTL